MRKMYEICIRFQPDGRFGAAVWFYKDGSDEPDPNPIAVHTKDFPAIEQSETLDKYIPLALKQASEANEQMTRYVQQTDEALEKEAEKRAMAKVTAMLHGAVEIAKP